MTRKERFSASVDPELIEAGQKAVVTGAAASFSAWVNEALRRQVNYDRRMRALDEFLDAYEAEHGEISDTEIRDASRRARARAVVVFGDPEVRKQRHVESSRVP